VRALGGLGAGCADFVCASAVCVRVRVRTTHRRTHTVLAESAQTRARRRVLLTPPAPRAGRGRGGGVGHRRREDLMRRAGFVTAAAAASAAAGFYKDTEEPSPVSQRCAIAALETASLCRRPRRADARHGPCGVQFVIGRRASALCADGAVLPERKSHVLFTPADSIRKLVLPGLSMIVIDQDATVARVRVNGR
jgi:hypothetical protein